MTTTGLCLLATGLLAVRGPDTAGRRLAWLTRFRHAAVGPSTTRLALILARISSGLLARSWVGVVLLAGVCGLLAGPIPGLLAFALAWVATRCWRWLAAERDDDRAQLELLTTVAALADEYDSGATVSAAFAAAAPISARYRQSLERAGSLASAGDEVGPALASQSELAPLAVACTAAERGGMSLSGVLAGVRGDLVADRQTRSAVRTALTGSRTSAILLAALPAVGLLMGTAMGANPATVLLHTGIGLIALTAGVVLDVIGLVWTMLLTRRALP